MVVVVVAAIIFKHFFIAGIAQSILWSYFTKCDNQRKHREVNTEAGSWCCTTRFLKLHTITMCLYQNIFATDFHVCIIIHLLCIIWFIGGKMVDLPKINFACHLINLAVLAISYVKVQNFMNLKEIISQSELASIPKKLEFLKNQAHLVYQILSLSLL